jgi:FKBP-type peptidyl-prolyl cis-trans isomerase SlyD
MNICKDAFVTFHYAIVTEESEVKDGSRNDDPLTYVHGYSMLVPGLEDALEGRSAGDHFQVLVEAGRGYGERDEELFDVLPREAFAEMPGLQKGMLVQLEDEDGEPRLGRVAEIDIREVKVDLNHPFAGEDLNFDVEVIDVRMATEEELAELAE